jgi:Tfp pilus assembly pilus retraction ATPase PilT
MALNAEVFLEVIRRRKAFYDLHLVPGRPPLARVNGRLVSLLPRRLTPMDIQVVVSELCPAGLLGRLARQGHIHFTFRHEGMECSVAALQEGARTSLIVRPVRDRRLKT